MLLVTFHGGSTGVMNVYAFDTSTGDLLTDQALQGAPLSGAELRGMVSANSLLYVVNGAKKPSTILCFQPPGTDQPPYPFDFLGDFLGPVLSKKGHFENSIGHPYALQFSGNLCYVSNQDTNVVARASVSSDFQTATIEPGCQSDYLNNQTDFCPPSGCVYLDGTFVASRNGTLPDVQIAATDVPKKHGGLAVDITGGAEGSPAAGAEAKPKVQNSVRDLAIAGNVLLVCDEPKKVIRLYSLEDGTYLGSSPALSSSPTHLAIYADGLYVSAGNQLYWSSLGDPADPASLDFTSVLTAPSGYKVGGIAIDPASNTAYVAFQQGTGTTGSGQINRYDLALPALPAPPVFGAGATFAECSKDTPEFLLFLPDL
jgi:hypothetical protein